ncbi:bifunctional YncE family protein/alkaline phosphatase family protein [Telluribacter sp.]|jgi:YVTN family beta-propeller protein|uniref:bifunctional YncE family protein/alkaline phosphatase family protein n=1 Tax=Telluribacter sp. TaxID=1978767 RepID=UPI002E14E629|nr:bifunctional YncE family protein/alkaline phosphatase family protein [Telluribacter sp.]
MKKILLPLLLTLPLATTQAQTWVANTPAGTSYLKIDREGTTTLPNGRYITPTGRQLTVAPHPYGLALSADGSVAVTANSGINPFSISIIRDVLGANPAIQQVPEGAKTDNGILEACFMGLAITPDNQSVYVAGGETNQIFLFDLKTGKKKSTINCATKANGINYYHGYIGDMVLTRDGSTLYAVDQIGFRLLVIDTKTQKIRHNIPTGRYPFGLCLSPNEQRVYVANVGVFEYKPFTDLDPNNLKETAHTWPATKYGSREMVEGVTEKGVPALGDPNAPEAFSVWSYELSNGQPKVKSKIKTGILVGQMVEDFPAVGGSSPNSLAATDRYVFVSNGNNDCVSVIDMEKDTVVNTLFLNPEPRLGQLRGLIPFGVTVSPDQRRLYVAEAGINAVAVVDIPTQKVLGHIPTGWFPSKLKTSPDGKKLIVANAKGFGSGPNGGQNFVLGPDGSYIGNLMKGTVSVLDIPVDSELPALTEKVKNNNFRFSQVRAASRRNPIPPFPGAYESPIKHIVFIAKENRTYDEVFGQHPGANGDSTIARYGLRKDFVSRDKQRSVQNGDIMPNHHQLARRYAMSDNYYCDSDVSADGHRWLVSTYPNEWVETGTAAAYGGRRSLRDTSSAPGNLAFYGSAGSIYPEDYNEAGSMWEHLERNKKDFFNYGFGVEMAAAYSDSTMKYIGELYTVNYPLPAPLYDKSSKVFPTYNMAIPDQFRADVFMKEFKEKWMDANKPLPSVLTLMLPNDHGTRERPAAGFPFTESYMADNDLALGRTIEFLSRTPYWKNMMIVVTEDDPQGGVDHVDAHRSLLMVISPYAKKNYVGHQHYSFGSIFKTFWHVLGIPYLNQYDATASDMSDLFTTEPDFTPYNAVAIDPRIFEPQKALTPFDEKFDWKAFAESEEMDRTETMQKRRAEDDEELKNKPEKKPKRKVRVIKKKKMETPRDF